MRRTRDSTASHVPVILDHDGGVDDFIALVIIATAQAAPQSYDASKFPPGYELPRYKLLGVTIVEADCFAEPCADVCRRVLSIYGRECAALADVPVAVSDRKAVANVFPSEWRKDSWCLADFPVLNTPAVEAMLRKRSDYATLAGGTEPRNGHKLLGKLVVESDAPVTICVTGPMSNVAFALQEHGDAFCANIDKIIVMGGAFHAGGNVFQKNLPETSKTKVDESAEWNVYWDAPSFKKVIEDPRLSKKIVLFGLDATNSVPVTSELIRRFGNECVLPSGKSEATIPTLLSQFVGGAWSFYSYAPRSAAGSFFAWDALTAAFLIDPTVVTAKALKKVTVIDTRNHPSEGRTVLHENEDIDDAEKNAIVILSVDAKKFDNLVVDAAKPF